MRLQLINLPDMKTDRLKLSDMGTGGLLQWIAAGENAARTIRSLQSVFRMRTGQAAKIIAARYGEEAAALFRKVAAREHAARMSVARLASGGCVACRATVSEAARAALPIQELCRRAGVDYAAAVDVARIEAHNRPTCPSTENARAFLAAL